MKQILFLFLITTPRITHSMLGPTDDPSCYCRTEIDWNMAYNSYSSSDIQEAYYAAQTTWANLHHLCAAKMADPQQTAQSLLTLTTLACLRNWTHLDLTIKTGKESNGLPEPLKAKLIVNKTLYDAALEQVSEIMADDTPRGELLITMFQGADEQSEITNKIIGSVKWHVSNNNYKNYQRYANKMLGQQNPRERLQHWLSLLG